VNIDDVKVEKIQGDRLDLIFQRQKELLKKYDQIEVANGLRYTSDCPVNLNDKKGQSVLKDYAWRITEELGEALEAFVIHPDIPQHCDEEIADSLHFLTEFTILAGVSPDQIILSEKKKDKLSSLYEKSSANLNYLITLHRRSYISICFRVGRFTESLAKTCNCLKNKPWKQTQMVTDVDYFRNNLVEAWTRFIQICISAKIPDQYLFELYFKKSEVNKFRQRSNY